MAESMTQAERLAIIETLVRRAIVDLDEIKAAQHETKLALDADKAELAALKNKGAGILIAVGLAAGVVGAVFKSVWQHFFGGSG